MSEPEMREAHIFADEGSRALRGFERRVQTFARRKLDCNPDNNIGGICFECSRAKSKDFEAAARRFKLEFEWGEVGVDWLATFALGDYLLAVSNAPAIHCFDVTDPESPTQTDSLTLPETPLSVWATQGMAVVGSLGQFFVINIDDSSDLTLVETITVSGNFNRAFSVGKLLFLTGAESGLVVFDLSFSPPRQLARLAPLSVGFSSVALRGRRLFLADVGESGVANSFLRSFRIGGFFCHAITTAALRSEEIEAEEIHARHGKFKGDVVAHGVTIAESGNLTVAGYIKLGERLILAGTGDPNTVVEAPIGSIFLSDTGAVYRNTDGATAWTAM